MEHDGTDLQFMNDSEPPNVFEFRGYHVMLAAKVAEVFEVETGRNQGSGGGGQGSDVRK